MDANKKAQPAPAPLPEEVKEAVARLKVSVQNVVMGGWKQAMPDLDTLLRSISDLARRLAEAEARLEFYQGLAKERHDREVACIARAEAAEARVRELEAFKTSVMEWAQGRCECCDNEPCEDEVDRPAACINCDNGSNWTPPQAWEVGE